MITAPEAAPTRACEGAHLGRALRKSPAAHATAAYISHVLSFSPRLPPTCSSRAAVHVMAWVGGKAACCECRSC